jgi:hypothetical protein
MGEKQLVRKNFEILYLFMKTDKVLFFKLFILSVFILINGVCQSQNKIRPGTEITINLNPRQQWMRTGIYVNANDKISIQASGSISYIAANRNKVTTPAGSNCPGNTTPHPFPEPLLPCYSLIAKIGNDGTAFEVGNFFSATVNQQGFLWVGINDEYPDDNENVDNGINAKITICESCKMETSPQIGDVIMYWIGEVIVHSGVVDSVCGCRVAGISCVAKQHFYSKLDPDNKSMTDPGEYGYGHNWTIYRSSRGSNELVNEPGGGVTDKGTIILLSDPDFPNWQNCHGYTFENNKFGITGYQMPFDTEKHDNNNSPFFSQSTAAKFILADNGYTQIHATGVSGIDQFKIIYSPEVFKETLPKRTK